MQKKGQKTSKAPKIKNILITQPRPDSDKSPYFELERKYSVSVSFHPFIRIEGVPSKDFRKQKIDIATFTAVIFTSRHAIDHFFRICEEMRINVSQDTKYFRSGSALPSEIYFVPQAQSLLWRRWNQ